MIPFTLVVIACLTGQPCQVSEHLTREGHYLNGEQCQAAARRLIKDAGLIAWCQPPQRPEEDDA